MGRKITVNEYLGILSARLSLIEERSRTGRDLNKECGYPSTLTPADYWWVYDREELAAKLVNIYPEESWSVDPEIYETERVNNTPFEEGWLDLVDSPDRNPLHYLLRCDSLSGVGRYGCLLIGLDDRMPLDQPAAGIDENGKPTGGVKPREMIYLRAFDEAAAEVKTWQTDPNSPRYMLPKSYNMTFVDAQSSGPQVRTTQHEVHWSRVHHMADRYHKPTKSEVFAYPRLEGLYNRLLDIRKVLGGSGEMFYKGGFPGLAITSDPRFLEAGGLEIDQDTIDEQMKPYMEGLQRYISFIGMNVQSLSPQVADPTAHVMVHMSYISAATGIPLRILMGSEQAKLAAGQDSKTWNRRLTRRQTKYLSPMVVRPFVDRLIMLGVLPGTKKKAKDGRPKYKVFWPDINIPDDDERSTIADRTAAAMMKYRQSDSHELLQPSDFFRLVLGWNADMVAAAMANIKKDPEIEFKEKEAAGAFGGKGNAPGNGGGDSGVAGKPPSDPKPVQKK